MDRRVITGAILVALGVMAYAGLNLTWPFVFFVLPGLVMLAVALGGGKLGALIFSIPGTFTAGTGAILFFQNWSGYWESWTYIWTLYGVFLGLGLMIIGNRVGEASLRGVGAWVVRASLILTVVFGLFFELLFFSGNRGLLLSLALIGLGLYLLAKNAGLRDGEPKAKRKPKHGGDRLFTGPVVYGARVASRRSGDEEDAPKLPY